MFKKRFCKDSNNSKFKQNQINMVDFKLILFLNNNISNQF